MTDELGKRMLQADDLTPGQVSEETMNRVLQNVRLARKRSRRMLWLTLVAWGWAALFLAAEALLFLRFRLGCFQDFIPGRVFWIFMWIAFPGMLMLPLGVAFGLSYLIRSRGTHLMEINARLMRLEKAISDMATLHRGTEQRP